jgi:hypothetical protein
MNTKQVVDMGLMTVIGFSLLALGVVFFGVEVGFGFGMVFGILIGTFYERHV